VNFAAQLIQRLNNASCLIDAPTGETLAGSAIPGIIAGFANGFLSSGLKLGDRLLLGCGVTPASALAYLGAIYVGIVPLPVEERLLGASGEALASSSGAKAVWTEKTTGFEWVQRNRIQGLHGRFEPRSTESVPPASCGQNDLAALMPTSGSTSLPRLVMVSHGNLISNTEAIVRSQKLGATERAMLIMPVSYCFGASVMHTHLWQGGGVVLD
jgi:acyl-CoA synthetase (AMP-forming)/AMP-acid ligase II